MKAHASHIKGGGAGFSVRLSDHEEVALKRFVLQLSERAGMELTKSAVIRKVLLDRLRAEGLLPMPTT